MSMEDFNIVFPKAGRAQSVTDSFAAGNDSYLDSPRSSVHNHSTSNPAANEEDNQGSNSAATGGPLPPLDYGLETPQMTPKLVRSLMHRRVTKIASGGVHNICVVEPCP